MRNYLFITTGFLVLFLFTESCLGGKDDDDDDYEDDDDQCYPGRNCIPGCYCSGSECRPYNHPKSPQHAKWKCRPFNYPKWKVHKKGSKFNPYASLANIKSNLFEKSELYKNTTSPPDSGNIPSHSVVVSNLTKASIPIIEPDAANNTHLTSPGTGMSINSTSLVDIPPILQNL